MMLYWHRWKTRHGVVYLLLDKPQTHDDSIRSTDEIAIVHRIAGRWRGEIRQIGEQPSYWLQTGSPMRTRHLVEDRISHKSVAMFGVDNVDFHRSYVEFWRTL